jgi:hypothetical protein
MKWEDTLRRFCSATGNQQWTDIAQDRAEWNELAAEFRKWSV